MLLTEFAGPDAHAAVIDIVDRLGLKGQAAVRALCELQVTARSYPVSFPKLGILD
jgi:hypothetical protein